MYGTRGNSPRAACVARRWVTMPWNEWNEQDLPTLGPGRADSWIVYR